MEPYSLEDLVRTSDEAAVRRRFERRNLTWLRILIGAFGMIAIIQVLQGISDDAFDHQVVIGTINVMFIGVSLWLMWDVRRLDQPHRPGAMYGLARLMRQHVNAFVITFAIVEYLLFISFPGTNEGWIFWTAFFPFFMLPFRFLPVEFILLHGFFAATAIVRGLMSSLSWGERAGTWAGMLAANLLVLGTALLFSRRMRKETVRDWSDRRVHAREQIRMRDELRYARELQVSMLPEEAPRVEWLDLAGLSIPATEVGGDYYDYFAVGDRLALVSGDVAGHGMASGLVLASLRSGFTLLRDQLDNPASVLQRLHDLVAQTTRRRMLATVAVLLLDRETSTATLSSAGHPPMILRRGSDGSVSAIELFAPPLGVRLPVDIPQIRFPIHAGDIFVLHTDGVYESRNDRDEPYGLERLEAVVAAHHEGGAATLRDAIIHDVDIFRGRAPQDDDVTVVVAVVR